VVKEPGRLTRRIVEALVSEIGLADEVMIESAVETLLERQKAGCRGRQDGRSRRRARRTRAVSRPAARDRGHRR
jgi:hypothetical protein